MKMNRNLFGSFILIVTLICKLSVASEPQSDEKNVRATESKYLNVQMKSTSTFSVPATWTVKKFEDYVELVAPEKDLSIILMEVENSSASNKDLSTEAWKRVRKGFDLPVSVESASPPSSDAWKNGWSVRYDVPQSESRTVEASGRCTPKGRVYLTLLEGTEAGLSRRAAQVGMIVDSWKPPGFIESSLEHCEPNEWTTDHTEKLEDYIKSSMGLLKVPGVSIGIIDKTGKVLYKGAFGVKKHGVAEPVETNTLFRIGSITKPLTTLLMAMLVDREVLDWKTTVKSILPNFRLDDADLTDTLTVQQTATGSTGMPRRDAEFIFKYKKVTPEDRIKEMATMKPTTKFGEVFQYSNLLVAAGGYATARAFCQEGDLQEAYETAMKMLVFGPLQMKRSVLKFEDALELGAAYPHALNLNEEPSVFSPEFDDFAYSVAPAGAVWSTVEDMMQYLLLELNEGVLAGRPIIKKAPLLERRKPVVEITEHLSYGTGLGLARDRGLNNIGHSGGTLGFSSNLFFLPEKGLGVVILTNIAGADDFLSGVKSKLRELVFNTPPFSNGIVQNAVQVRQKGYIEFRKHIDTRPSSVVVSVAKLLGKEFVNNRLGRARVKLLSSANGLYFEMEVGDLKSVIGVELDKNGKTFLVLVDPFYQFKFLVEEPHGSSLVFEMGQERYEFLEVK